MLTLILFRLGSRYPVESKPDKENTQIYKTGPILTKQYSVQLNN